MNHIQENQIEQNILFPLGGGCIWFTDTAPTGFLICDGSEISRTTYADLFAIIGTTYGSGDGSTTFNLPDKRQRFPLGKADSGTGSTLADTGGAIDHAHTISTDGVHTHDVTVPPITASLLGIGLAPVGDDGTYATTSAGNHNHTGNTGTNNPPYLTVNFIIRVL